MRGRERKGDRKREESRELKEAAMKKERDP